MGGAWAWKLTLGFWGPGTPFCSLPGGAGEQPAARLAVAPEAEFAGDIWATKTGRDKMKTMPCKWLIVKFFANAQAYSMVAGAGQTWELTTPVHSGAGHFIVVRDIDI